MQPNHITFTPLLSAYSHAAGLVEVGWYHFNSMNRHYVILPKMEHHACMVHLRGWFGCLDEAHDFIQYMPFELDTSVCGYLFGACKIHRNVPLAECVARQLFETEPDDAGNYVLLSNIC